MKISPARPRSSVARVLAGLIAVALAGAGPTLAESRLFAQATTGPLVIVGGRLDSNNEPIYRAILGLRFEDGPICVIPAGSSEPGHTVESDIADFERYGGPGTAISVPPLDVRRADKAKIARLLSGCGGFFFTGEDSTAIIDTLRPGGRVTRALQAILDTHRRGAVIAGSSAGADIMTDSMIGAGTSDDALRNGLNAEGLRIGAGLGLFRGAIADQHHMARGRTGRLIVALAALPGTRWGFGIDDDTALVVRGTMATVVGSSMVVVLEKLNAGTGPNHLDGASFRVLMLGNNDAFDLMAGTAAVDGRKEVLSDPDARPIPPTGPWLATGLPLFLVDLAVSDVETAGFTASGYLFRLTKQDPFQARAWELPDGEDVPHGFTAGWFRLDLSRLE